jgi:hypothetical protein
MESFISFLKTPDECDKMVVLFEELAKIARLRSVELRAEKKGFNNEVEFELLKVLYAYEDILRIKNNRKTSASRTWQMIRRDGIITAAEKAVNRETDAMGYKILADRGIRDLTFEAVILKYPKYFSKEAVIKSRTRLEELEKHYASRFDEKQ